MERQISISENKASYSSNQCCTSNPETMIGNIFGRKNLRDLEKIRKVILVEENKPLKLKEVFKRVLEHYNKSVNYR